MDDFKTFHKPPTIEEREPVNPYDHYPLIQETAVEMIEMNTPYIGKVMPPEEFQIAMVIHVNGIINGLERGTAKLNKTHTTILFWHPGKGEYVPYDLELQSYLLGFIGAFKQSYGSTHSHGG